MNEQNNINFNNINNNINNNIKKGNKKLIIILLIIGISIATIGFIIYQLLFPKISLGKFKESYNYEELNYIKKKVKATLFVNKNKTV